MQHATPISLDVNDDHALDAEVGKHDLVISLIPYTFHATVIKSAIRQKKHVVTTSYVSPAMMELDQQAKDAGITVMNEIGLDPYDVNWLSFYLSSYLTRLLLGVLIICTLSRRSRRFTKPAARSCPSSPIAVGYVSYQSDPQIAIAILTLYMRTASPEDSDNPLGYKFSWSSRGVVSFLCQPCRYLRS